MSRSYKKTPAEKDLSGELRHLENRRRRRNEKRNLNKGKEVIDGDRYDHAMTIYDDREDKGMDTKK